MKKMIRTTVACVMIGASLLLTACGKSTLDLSSEEKFDKTLNAVLAELPDDFERMQVQGFVMSRVLAGGFGAMMGGFTGNRAEYDKAMESLAELQGLSAQELSALAREEGVFGMKKKQSKTRGLDGF